MADKREKADDVTIPQPSRDTHKKVDPTKSTKKG